ncbi:MAG TPA: DUF2793 domain-containing protein [Thermoanaerobaculaceae bacterium]|nr:DUF2793 domain-containing protein [Thermoanaerobaculaceae bacterium]
MVQPVFFDGTTNELKRASATNPIDDAALPSTAVRTSGATPFVAPQGGVDPVSDPDLTTQRAVRRFIAELGPWWGQVISAAVSNPSALTPTTDQRWLVASPGAGAWAGHAGQLATWRGAAWVYATPTEGTTVFDQNTGFHLSYVGAAWGRAFLHEVLSDLLGGQAAQHYHLTAAQHAGLTTSQAAALFWATPNAAPGAPAMRALLLSDLPVAAGAGRVVVSGVGGVAAWAVLDASAVGAVPTTRTVATGTGLSGGGALSGDLTLSWNGLSLQNNGGAVVTGPTVNLVGEAKVLDAGGGTLTLELPDATLYAMIFGRR